MIKMRKQDLVHSIVRLGNDDSSIKKAVYYEQCDPKYNKKNAYCNFYFINHHCLEIKLPNGSIMAKSFLINALKKDISSTFKGMEIKNLWLDGVNSKEQLIKLLPQSRENYFWVTTKKHAVHSVNDLIGENLAELGENEWFAMTQHRRLIENLKWILSKLHKHNPHIVKAVNRLIYLMKGRNGLGQYLRKINQKYNYSNKFFKKILNRSQTVLLLKDNKDQYHLKKLHNMDDVFFTISQRGVAPLKLHQARSYVQTVLHNLRHEK